jgi:Helix-turn-helix domain
MTAHVSAARAARMYGRSEKTVRRWIASGKLPAEKIDGVYLVNTADVARLVGDVSAPMSTHVSAPRADSMSAQSTDTDVGPHDEDVRPSDSLGTDIMRAEAMAAYTRSLLEPLVALVNEQETTIRGQAEMIGRQSAELERDRATIVILSDELAAIRSISSLDARTATEIDGTAPEPFTGRLRPLTPGLMTTLAVVALVVLTFAALSAGLVWPR